MIIYTDPDTGYQRKCSFVTSVPNGVAYKEVPSHERDEFNEAIIGYDAQDNPIFDIIKAREIKVNESKIEAANMLKVITDNYDVSEIATWDIQEAEARGNTPDTFLSTVATVANTPLTALKTSIITKADAYRALSAESIGRRKKKEAACMAATTVNELKAVIF